MIGGDRDDRRYLTRQTRTMMTSSSRRDRSRLAAEHAFEIAMIGFAGAEFGDVADHAELTRR